MTTQQPDIEKTLKRILARELHKWPGNWNFCGQTWDAQIYFDNNEEDQENFRRGAFLTLAKDHETARVTRADWEAERALLASEQAQPLGDSEEFDQALWEKVAFQTHEALFKTDDGLALGFDARAVFSFDEADAFMAERAKRIAARKSNHD